MTDTIQYPIPLKDADELKPTGAGYTYEYTEESLQEERTTVWNFIKRLGNSFLEGKNLVSISMPVNFCEPASFLERMTRGWVTMPAYCKLIEATDSDVEKMKLAVAMVISGLHINTNCKKPFNPLLGETYESTFEDGTKIFAEQSTHHPPVSTWQTISENPKWKFTGTAKWAGYFAGNAVKGGEQGTKVLEFESGYRVQWSMPNIYVSGILTGKRILDHVGFIEFKDNSSPPLTCKVGFGDQRHLMEWMSDGSKWLAGALTGGWWSTQDEKQLHKDDELSGEIYIQSANSTSDTEQSRISLATISGSWLTGISFKDNATGDVQCYWKRSATPTTKIDNSLPNHPLPSDSRLRLDISELAKGNIEAAQEHKEVIEEEQRRYAKLRKGQS